MAQTDHSSHQQKTKSNTDTTTKVGVVDGNTQKQLSGVLSSHLNIKNALVAGDSVYASSNADALLKTAHSVDYKVISQGNLHTLVKDAGNVSETKDLKQQREYFANFFSNMAAVAKASKLTGQPVYLQYCLIKKASWLSAEKTIRNPYYGSSMLSCDEVTETL